MRIILRTQTALDKTLCITRTLAVHDQVARELTEPVLQLRPFTCQCLPEVHLDLDFIN
jgi:hypothetical protein